MAYVVTLAHVRYGRVKLDLAELRRRVEFRLAAGSRATRLPPLLACIQRLMTLIDDLDDAGRNWDGRRALDAELALLLLDFDLVQAVLAGRAAPRVGRRPVRALPGPKKRSR